MPNAHRSIELSYRRANPLCRVPFWLTAVKLPEPCSSFTHAVTVKPALVRTAGDVVVSTALLPLKWAAFPIRPAVHDTAPLAVAVRPEPDSSAAVVPEDSS